MTLKDHKNILRLYFSSPHLQTVDLLDDGRVFGSVAGGSHPLVHHDSRVAVDQEAQEEEYDGRYDHDAQGVELVVLRKAGTVEVEAGVQLDADQGQNDADAVGDGLRVGLEVLQDQLEALHGSRTQPMSNTQQSSSFLERAADAEPVPPRLSVRATQLCGTAATAQQHT